MTRTAAIMASYDHGASNQPLLGETIGENFNRIATTHADREALVDRFTGRRWTYARLHHDVLALAHGLIRLGIDKGDRVGIWAPNCPEWTVLQYATAEIGAILVPINPATAPTNSRTWSTRRASACWWPLPPSGHPTTPR
jgi:Acyl-CoA synthetases (AMP-forming)/AMP-acid ligases II